MTRTGRGTDRTATSAMRGRGAHAAHAPKPKRHQTLSTANESTFLADWAAKTESCAVNGFTL